MCCRASWMSSRCPQMPGMPRGRRRSISCFAQVTVVPECCGASRRREYLLGLLPRAGRKNGSALAPGKGRADAARPAARPQDVSPGARGCIRCIIRLRRGAGAVKAAVLRRPARPAGRARGTRHVLRFWLPVALDGRTWHPDRLRRLRAYQPRALSQLFDLMAEVTSARPFTERERGILVAACASTRGHSYCWLAWGTKLAEQAGPRLAAGFCAVRMMG